MWFLSRNRKKWWCSYVDFWRNSIPGRGKNICKVIPKPGSLLSIVKESKEANVTEVDWVRRRILKRQGGVWPGLDHIKSYRLLEKLLPVLWRREKVTKAFKQRSGMISRFEGSLIILLQIAFGLVCIDLKCQWVGEVELLGSLDIWVWNRWG